MSRLIDADALIAWIKGSQQMTSKMKSLICYIKTMPTIDAVSVVRCKECKYKDDIVNYYYENDRNIKADDFCSYGEREGER